MNQEIFSYSESIVFSLCKEIEFIKIRSKNIIISLETCHSKSLSKRLKIELDKSALRHPITVQQILDRKKWERVRNILINRYKRYE